MRVIQQSLLVMVTILISTMAWAEENNRLLIVGSEQDYPPFAIGLTDETAGGFTVELWKAVAKETGHNYSIHVRPFRQILQEFKDRKIDVLINLAQSDERRQFADFTVTHATVNGAIFVRDGENHIQTEADLAGKSIIVLNADLGHDYAIYQGWQKQLVLVDTTAQGFKLLASGHCDAMLISKLAGMQTLQALNLDNLHALSAKAGFSQKFSFAVHKGQSGLLAELNEGLALTKANGVYDALYEKWFGVYEQKRISLQDALQYLIPIPLPIAMVLLVLTGLFLYKRQSERRQTNLLLHASEDRLRTIFETSPESIKLITIEGILLDINTAGLKMIEADDEKTAIGQNFHNIVATEYRSAFCQLTERTCQGQKGILELEIVGLQGTRRWIETHTIPFLNPANGELVELAISRDVTERKLAEAEIKQVAFYDPLTQVGNRRLLHERLKHGIEMARRDSKQMALLILDLDRFKAVNDSLGHLAGDELLQQVATRMTDMLRDVDMVARLGGDEFTVLLEQILHVDDAARVAEEIIIVLSKPFKLSQSDDIRISASIGISLYPQHGDSPEILMDHADAALYQAKDLGRGCCAYYSEDITRLVRERIAHEVRLRDALEKQELRVFYQPQMDIASGRIIGAEALVRWQDPVNGLTTPIHFITMAEESRLIVKLGEWVLRETCKQGRLWLDSGLLALNLSVNVSPYQFQRSDINALISKVLAETNFPAELLELEITESGLMGNQDNAMDILNKLRNQGIRLAIDDFGTGYSSLAYLKRFPLDTLKIDKSFIDEIPHNKDDMEIASTILAMGHTLGLKITAEGVETQEQLVFLQKIGCDAYQGFIKSQALPSEEFAKLVCAQQQG